MNVPLLVLHIGGGSTALLSGAAALSLRKGGTLHARAGTIFFGAMLLMTATGTTLAILKPERGTATIGILTCYLVATSWATARNREGRTGRFERVALGVALGVALACLAAFLTFIVQGFLSPKGHVDLLPRAALYPFAFLAALAAALDLNHMLRPAIAPRQRIARHLWRMCAALLIAAFSFFLGQQKVMPAAWRGSPLFFLPELAVLAAMIFWLVRVRFGRAYGGRGPRRASPAVLAADGAAA